MSRFYVFAVSAVFFLLAKSAGAAFITVNTLDNESNSDGDCSLREAILSANQNTSFDACAAGDSVGDLIFLGISGTITVTSALLVTERVEILGPGMDALTISGQGATSLFVVDMPDDGHDFELSLVTLADGSETVPGAALWLQNGGAFQFEGVRFRNHSVSGSTGFGGAIAVELTGPGSQFSLTIRRCRFLNNSAPRGGAIGIDGSLLLDSLTIEETAFEDNMAAERGGAITVRGTDSVVMARNVFLRNNALTSAGGAILLDVSDAKLQANSFVENVATSSGALHLQGGDIRLENNSLVGNGAESGNGEAIRAVVNVTLSLVHNTFFENALASPASSHTISLQNNSTMSLSHNIIWSSQQDNECFVTSSSTLTSLGRNIDGTGSCTGHFSDLPMTNPMLAPLDDYGDDTSWVTLPTLLPLTGSPAIDGGIAAPCVNEAGVTIATDQRGEPRPVNGDGNGGAECDIGAVEFQPGSDPESFSLSISVSGDGSVASNPASIDCPDDCDQSYLDGTDVALTATPGPGSAFTGWSGDCTGTGPCQVTMDQARSVAATFESTVVTFPVEVELDGNGVGMVTSTPAGIDCPGDCSEAFEDGETVTLSAIAGGSSEFLGWSADCGFADTGACQLTVDQAHRAIAIFGDGDLLFLDGFE